MIHRAAADGYREVADRYERGRAGYPDAAVETVLDVAAVGPGAHVVEVGAGTGKFTGHLVDSGASVTAIEPVPDMRRKLASRFAALEIHDGTAERMPVVPDGAADAVVAAQAFHWFDGAAALTEFRRVLKAGGALALVWNVTDREEPWVDRVWRIVDRHEGDAPRYHRGEWRSAFADRTDFTELEHRAFPNPVPVTVDALVDRILSISFIAALDGRDQRAVAAEVRAEMQGESEPLVFPYRTDVYWCRAVS